MSLNSPNLDSVTSINEDGSRRFIHPANVKGIFSTLRSLTGLLLLSIYVALPWIPINGNPAVFFDVARLQFHLFGLTFVTQDLWLAFFLVSGTGFCLFYVTAVLGRIWCGWACPQTVYLDIVRRVERWIEGDALARHKLDASSWTFEKVCKRGLKHLFMISFALLLAHMFLSYYVSLPKLYAMMKVAPWEHWNAFAFVFIMAGALWFNFAWFREQFCIVLCPYGRLQSALIDPHTLTIGYDAKRGEPRGKKSDTGAGDCVDCNRCVQVCPTGIDIRMGVQMECIGCAACVDACNTVMDKLQRPRGLVRYDSPAGFAGQARRWIRPRIIVYTGLLVLGATAMTAGLSTLRPANASFTRMIGSPYFLDQGRVRNQFMLRVINQRNTPVTFHIEFPNAPAELVHTGADEPIIVGALDEQSRPLVLTMPRDQFKAQFPLKVRIVSADGKTSIEKTVPFVGPGYYGQ